MVSNDPSASLNWYSDKSIKSNSDISYKCNSSHKTQLENSIDKKTEPA